MPDNSNNGSEKTSTAVKGEIAALIILALLFIGGLVWFMIEYNRLYVCQHSESTLCPSIYCGDFANGKSSTKCYDADKGTGEKVAYRTDDKGNIQCQKYTLPPNVVPKT